MPLEKSFDALVHALEGYLSALQDAIQKSLEKDYRKSLDLLASFNQKLLRDLPQLVQSYPEYSDKLNEFYNLIYSITQSLVTAPVADLSQYSTQITQFIRDFINQIVSDAEKQASKVSDEITSDIDDTTSDIEDDTENITQVPSDNIATQDDLINIYLQGLQDEILKRLDDVSNKVNNESQSFWNGVGQWIGDRVSDITDFTKDVIDFIVGGFSEQTNKITDTVSQFFTSSLGMTLFEPFGVFLKPLEVLFDIADAVKTVSEVSKELSQSIKDSELLPSIGEGIHKSKELSQSLSVDTVLPHSPYSDIQKITGLSAATTYGGMPLISFLFPPLIQDIYNTSLGELARALGRETLQPYKISPNEACELRLLGKITPDEYYQICNYQGFNNDQADKLFERYERIPDLNVLATLYFRGFITKEDFKSELSRMGYDEWYHDKIIKSLEYYPSPADIVRFAIREVYNPEVRKKYGQDEDISQDYIESAKHAGLSEEFSRDYWAAHWNLPSVSDAFEMLHRGVISEDELKDLLKAQDIMPFWRDKLIEISHVPFTRVDVRRMYQLGVLSRDEVFRSYKDIGYDDWHAEKLTEFTIKSVEQDAEDEAKDEKNLTASEIMRLYSEDIIDEQTFRDLMKGLNFSDETIDYKLLLSEYNKFNTIRKMYIDSTHALFDKGIITENEAISRLSSYNLSSNEINGLIEKWKVERIPAARIPTYEQLTNMFIKGLIDENDYFNALLNLGYSEKWASLLIEMNRGKIKSK